LALMLCLRRMASTYPAPKRNKQPKQIVRFSPGHLV
jgi:hypothetical protein